MRIPGSRKTHIRIVISLLIIIAFSVVMDKVIMPLIVSSSRTITVPNIIGMQRQQAIDMIESQGLKVERIAEQFNSSVAHGVVVFQLPFPNSQVKEGRRIYLTVSKGDESITMPDLSMMTQRDAQLALMRLGLQVGTISWDYRDSLPENRVIRQSYLPGMSVGNGSVVNLVLSKDSNATVIVPMLERLSMSDALRTLQDVSLQADDVVQQPDGTYAVGTVLKQVPTAGTKTRPGTKVKLWVASQD